MIEFIVGASITMNFFLIWKLWERDALVEALMNTNGDENGDDQQV